MRRTLVVSLALFALISKLAVAQVSGNAAFAQGGGKSRAEQAERAKRIIAQHDIPPTSTTTYLEASVLINVKADEYVAMFGLSQEANNVAECVQKMDATVARFTDDLKVLGIAPADSFVDFVAQNRVYGYEIAAETAREKLTGFELKKTISIHYKDRTVLDRLVLAAAKSDIHDLIKVEYIVRDTAAIEDRLMDAASKILKRKASRYEKLLGIKLRPPAQVYAERYSVYYPTDLYDSYIAAESQDIAVAALQQKYAVLGARKARTFFFNSLDGNGFDEVIDPLILEPAVQFTLYLKVKYEVAPQASD